MRHWLERLARRAVCLLLSHDWRPVYDGSAPGFYEACSRCECVAKGVRA